MGDCAGDWQDQVPPGMLRVLGLILQTGGSPEALDRAAVRLRYGGGCAARLRAGGLGGRITVFGGCRGSRRSDGYEDAQEEDGEAGKGGRRPTAGITCPLSGAFPSKQSNAKSSIYMA